MYTELFLYNGRIIQSTSTYNSISFSLSLFQLLPLGVTIMELSTHYLAQVALPDATQQ